MQRNIIILGLVSLFTDISSEMIYPLVPIYLTSVLGASPAVLGLIEGVSESLASLLRIVSGRVSDHFAMRKPLAIGGYGLSAVGKFLFVVATSWTGIFFARISDRLGKGIRTAPRDAMIADSSMAENRGRSFGLHRAMDTAGAVIGISLAYWLFTQYQGNYQILFWVAVIPAIIGVILLFFAQEVKIKKSTAIQKLTFSWAALDKRLRGFIIITFLFNLGNSSNQFLLVRAGNFGFAPEQVVLLYLLMNISYFLVTYPAGRLSDYIGRRAVVVTGYTIYGLVYMGFAVAGSQNAIVVLFVLYGLYTGLTEGVEKALLADMAPVNQTATVYGIHALTVGLALLPASLIAGLLWDTFGAAAAFWFGSFTGLAAAAAIWVVLRI